MTVEDVQKVVANIPAPVCEHGAGFSGLWYDAFDNSQAIANDGGCHGDIPTPIDDCGGQRHAELHCCFSKYDLRRGT